MRSRTMQVAAAWLSLGTVFGAEAPEREYGALLAAVSPERLERSWREMERVQAEEDAGGLLAYVSAQFRAVPGLRVRRVDLSWPASREAGATEARCSVRYARLRRPGRGKVLISTETVPHLLAWGSDSFSGELDVADVGAGTSPEDYAGRDVAGKLVMAGGPLHVVYEQSVVRRGARGVASFIPDEDARGIRKPADLPWRSLVSAERERLFAEAGTFALTVPRSLADSWRKTLRNGGAVRVQVDAEVDTSPRAEAVVAHLGTGDLTGARPSEKPVLVFASGRAGDQRGAVAVLLEIARAAAAAQGAGTWVVDRPLQFLVASEEAAVRAYARDRGPFLVWGLDAVGHEGAVPVLRRPPAFADSWLGDWAAVVLERDGLVARSEAYRRDRDRPRLVTPATPFPVLTLAEHGGTPERLCPRVLERAARAVLAGVWPAVTGRAPDPAVSQRLVDGHLAPAWSHLAPRCAEEARTDDGGADDIAERHRACMAAEADRLRRRWDAWVHAHPDPSGVGVLSGHLQRLEAEARREASCTRRDLFCDRGLDCSAVATAPEKESAGVVYRRRPGRLEVIGDAVWMDDDHGEGWSRRAVAGDPDAAFETLARLDGERSLVHVAAEIRRMAGSDPLATTRELAETLVASGAAFRAPAPAIRTEATALGCECSEAPCSRRVSPAAARRQPRPTSPPPAAPIESGCQEARALVGHDYKKMLEGALPPGEAARFCFRLVPEAGQHGLFEILVPEGFAVEYGTNATDLATAHGDRGVAYTTVDGATVRHWRRWSWSPAPSEVRIRVRNVGRGPAVFRGRARLGHI